MIKFQSFHSPQSIEEASFAIIDAEAPSPKPFSGFAWEIARRLVHSSADFDILNYLEFSDFSVNVGIDALKTGCIIYTDTEMAKAGMSRFRLDTLKVEVCSILSLDGVAELAKSRNSTRSLAGVELAWKHVQSTHNTNVVWAIGNAPTALIRLVELVELVKNSSADDVLPRLIIGLPVGFVNAAESKEFLCEQDTVPYLTLRGRKGGSTLAAATINALAELALRG